MVKRNALLLRHYDVNNNENNGANQRSRNTQGQKVVVGINNRVDGRLKINY
jgi:hypothetical protein